MGTCSSKSGYPLPPNSKPPNDFLPDDHDATSQRAELGQAGRADESVAGDSRLEDFQVCLQRIAVNDSVLTEVDLSAGGIGDQGSKLLSVALAGNTTVKRLILGWNLIGKHGAKDLAEALCTNVVLEELDLGGNGIGAEGGKHIADALCRNIVLKRLDLRMNGIGAKGAGHMAEALLVNLCSLQHLSLFKNEICDEGARLIAEAICRNSALRELDLTYNQIGAAGARHIADALRNNNSLILLDLYGNNIRDEGARHIAEAIRVNESLASLNLDDNSIGVEGGKALAAALHRNKSLTRLFLQSNDIGVEGVKALADALCHNTTLNLLDPNTSQPVIFGGSEIDGELEGRIKGTLYRNTVRRRHEEGVDKEGVSYFVSTEMGAAADNLTLAEQQLEISHEKMPRLAWKAARIREAAAGDGRALVGFSRVLQWIVAKCEDQTENPYVLPPAPDDLVTALKDPKARKALVDGSLDDLDKSTVLHLAATAEADCAVDVCRILVEFFDADFDKVKDGSGRSSRTIACANKNPEMIAWASRVGTLLKRYKIDEGPPVHKSATCRVVFATDIVEEEVERRHVALKIIAKRVHYERELGVRLVHRPGSGENIPPELNRFNESLVVKLHRYHDERDERQRQIFCLVMPIADRSLDIIIRAEHVAGRDIHMIRHLALNAARALRHLHSDHYLIHSDFKTRNIVRIGSGFSLIDFDSSTQTGDPVLTDKVSTGYFPPEIANVLFSNQVNLEELEKQRDEMKTDLLAITSPRVKALVEGELKATEETIYARKAGKTDHPKAHPTIDIWSFGVVMYYILTGTSLFKLNDDDNLASGEEERRLVHWQGIRSDHLRYVLANCPGASRDDISVAKDMLIQCLKANPCDRPQSMAEVLSLPFFASSEESEWTPLQRNSIRVLFSDPLVWTDKSGELHPIERLHFERERGQLEQCLKNSERNIDLTFDSATDARLQEFAAARCGCLHFSGHGLRDQNNNFIVFEDGSGGAHFLGSDGLRDLLKPYSQPFQLVFVSACHSECIGQEFVGAGVRHVVCCEQESKCMDDAAADFMRSFYDVLAEGHTVEMAFNSAKGAVAARWGEDESKKLLLLPGEGKHDTAIFDADVADCNKEHSIERHIPRPPVHFFGREIVMHQLVSTIMSGARLVTLIGEEGCGRSSLASAVSHYLKDRLKSNIYFEDIVYVQRKSLESGIESLLSLMYEQLVPEGAMENVRGKTLINRTCKALKRSKFLLVLDGIDGLEVDVCNFLRSLFESAEAKVLLTARHATNFLSSAVVEKVIHLNPLDFASAVNLFANICPHIDGKGLSLLSELPSKYWNLAEESRFSILKAILDGFPSRIIHCAQQKTREEYLQFVSDLEAQTTNDVL